MKRYLSLLFFLVVLAPSAQASMRCTGGIISGNELVAEVLRKCGNPDVRQVIAPVVGANGNLAYRAATVEDWVYGPKNGLYRYLRFIDGKLASVRSGRE